MKILLSFLFAICISVSGVCQISFFDWKYPKDIKDKDWLFIYDLIPDRQLQVCLDVRNLERLDRKVEDFYKNVLSRGVNGFPGEYRLPGDDPEAVLMDALILLS